MNLPRVTGIMRALNLVDDRWFTDEARDRGTAVHLALGYHAERDLKWASVADSIKPYVEAGIRFLEDSKAVVEAVEMEVVNERLGYTGHPDLLARVFGDECILDWKSGGIMLEPAGIQTAAYELALDRRGWRRMAIQLNANGTSKLHDLERRKGGWADRARFVAALDLYRHFIAPRNRRQQEDKTDAVA